MEILLLSLLSISLLFLFVGIISRVYYKRENVPHILQEIGKVLFSSFRREVLFFESAAILLVASAIIGNLYFTTPYETTDWFVVTLVSILLPILVFWIVNLYHKSPHNSNHLLNLIKYHYKEGRSFYDVLDHIFETNECDSCKPTKEYLEAKRMLLDLDEPLGQQFRITLEKWQTENTNNTISF